MKHRGHYRETSLEPCYDCECCALWTTALEFDGLHLSISVPATADGRELAEAWLAKWNRLVTPLLRQSSLYKLRVFHPGPSAP